MQCAVYANHCMPKSVVTQNCYEQPRVTIWVPFYQIKNLFWIYVDEMKLNTMFKYETYALFKNYIKKYITDKLNIYI